MPGNQAIDLAGSSDDEGFVRPVRATVTHRKMPEPSRPLSETLDRLPLQPRQPDGQAKLGRFERFKFGRGTMTVEKSKAVIDDDDRPTRRKRVLDSDSENESIDDRPLMAPGRALSQALANAPRKARKVELDDSGESQSESEPGAPGPETVPDTDIEEASEDRNVMAKRKMHVDLTKEDDRHASGLQRLAAQAGAQAADHDKDDESAHLDELLATCESISARLRSVVGHAGENRAGAGGQAAMLQLVTRAGLEAACGQAARYLKPYQLAGINFLMLLNSEGEQGALLADEPGLGKTCQLISYLGALRDHPSRRGRPHLIIVPASVLQNWQRELAMWCPALNVVPFFGPERQELRRSLQACRQEGETGASQEDLQSEASDSEGSGSESIHSEAECVYGEEEGDDAPLAPFDVMLTCYTLFERDSEQQRLDRSFLRSWRWSHLILDEAHAVKNRGAARSRRLEQLSRLSQHRIMLTGTPLQNNLGELYNLLRFLLPSLFQKLPPLPPAQTEEEEAALVARMKGILTPFVIRRLKVEVEHQLPAKSQEVREVAMLPAQARLYQETFAQLRSEVAQRHATHAGASSSQQGQMLLKRLGTRKVGNMFVQLRKIAQHPLLVRHLYSDDRVQELARLCHRRHHFGGQAKLERVLEELQAYSDFELHDLARSSKHYAGFCLEDSRVLGAAKCQLLAELLPRLQAAGSRPLIFSQWTQVLDVLEWLMDQLQLPYSRLDGSTAVADRQAIVDQFNGHPEAVFAMLMTTRAGGQGLNLTGADTVILHDVDFNPQIDRQAEDRCHRLGQTRPVTIHRLVTSGTVDEGIHAMAQRKLSLDAAVLGACSTAVIDDTSAATETSAMSELLGALLAEPGASSGSANVNGQNPLASQNHQVIALD